ncbi:MAG: flagellar protein FliS [Lachnospiraceae bacterium]|nr:flagellar protein FliS [Lachnospiraceae bacterium]
MNKEKISSFKLRITESNQTELIVILYEIYFAYLEDAKEVLEKMSHEDKGLYIDAYGKSLRMASQVLRHLKDDLNFTYDISANLFSLYDFCERSIAKASYSFEIKDLDNTLKVMKPLYQSFMEVAKNDNSKPVMQHAQKVSAGYTYGRNDVMESVGSESNRGFFA